MPFTLPSLPYPFEALEPHIDAQTMQIHHGKHHKAYVDNANKALEGTKWANADPVDVIRQLSDLPEDKRGPVRNNAGGHVNHSMFWQIMAPAGKGGEGSPRVLLPMRSTSPSARSIISRRSSPRPVSGVSGPAGRGSCSTAAR
jgi:Fe-Mn family superoxide dismutase